MRRATLFSTSAFPVTIAPTDPSLRTNATPPAGNPARARNASRIGCRRAWTCDELSGRVALGALAAGGAAGGATDATARSEVGKAIVQSHARRRDMSSFYRRPGGKLPEPAI